MNIYSRKLTLKFILIFIALGIGLTTLWYINNIVKNFEEDERSKIKLWANAIEKRSKIIEQTDKLFHDISIDERRKVELWAKAMKELSQNENLENIDFLLDVIKNNETVPVLLLDDNNNFINCRNFSKEDSALFATNKDYLVKQINDTNYFHNPIENKFYFNRKNYIYYKDSKIFIQLKELIDDLLKSFISDIVKNSISVPVIITNEKRDSIIAFGNIDTLKINDSNYFAETIKSMANSNKPIEVEINNKKQFVFYNNSYLLLKLHYYPYLFFSILGIFLFVVYWVFNTSRRAEQNQVWAGMAKETAHQLGTPLSSLIAWVEVLKEKNIGFNELEYIEKDIERLEIITERFSKIGSNPIFENVIIYDLINDTVDYLKKRTSQKVSFNISSNNNVLSISINKILFSWVIENLLKNAIDAMSGVGEININIIEEKNKLTIDVSDTGKGIQKSLYKTVFNPGFTTKTRGWGLGLSLAKRIIENYHYGKIFVKKSEINKGTTFRIILSSEKVFNK